MSSGKGIALARIKDPILTEYASDLFISTYLPSNIAFSAAAHALI